LKTPSILFAALLLVAPVGRAQEYGTIKATTKMRGDGSTSTTILDPEKKTAEETITLPGGKVQRKVIYFMDDRNFAYGAIFYDGAGNIIYKAGYKRDERGRVTESSFTSKDGRYLGKRLFQYTSGDQASVVEDYDAVGKLIPAKAPKPAGPGIPDKKKKR
jgi:hypothetical protein